MRKIMSCLDIGSSALKLVVAENTKNKTNILATSIVQSTSLKKNKVVDKEKLKEEIKLLFKDISEKLGYEIRATLVMVPSDNAEFTIGTSKIDVESEDYVITSHDIVKSVKQSAKGIIQDNMELVNIMPINFTIEDGTKVKNPTNLISKTLEAKTIIITSPKNDVYNILECLESLKIDVVDIAFDSIGDYYAFQNKETEEKVGAIVNVGHTKTTVSIFNRGVLTNTSLIYLGGKNIENDISYVYKIPIYDAIKLKENFALASKDFAIKEEKETLINNEGIKISINQYEISEIVESRLNEILNMTKKQINILTKKEISYIIFTGGVSEMADFKLTIENIFGKSVTLGNIKNIGARNNIFSSSLGLIKWYDYNQKLKNRDYSILSIDEQEDLGSEDIQREISENNGVISKVFGYFFDN